VYRQALFQAWLLDHQTWLQIVEVYSRLDDHDDIALLANADLATGCDEKRKDLQDMGDGTIITLKIASERR
jgi:hypothetical protein